MECLAMAGLTVDKDEMVFDIDSEDSRDQQHYIRVIAQVNDDAEQNVKRVPEGLPHELTLTFALPQIGGFSFGADSGEKANITRLPWGGARTKIVAYVRGAYLISNHHNGRRLAAFIRALFWDRRTNASRRRCLRAKTRRSRKRLLRRPTSSSPQRSALRGRGRPCAAVLSWRRLSCCVRSRCITSLCLSIHFTTCTSTTPLMRR